MQDLIRNQAFGTLVTLTSTGLFATHLPMVLELDGSAFGLLKGHVARANAQWRDFDASVDALAIFAGHHHYISASWYPAVSGMGAEKTGDEVPTWNYVTVHAYGPLRAVEDPEWMLAHLTGLTNIHEAASAQPWQVADAPADSIARQMRAIVGLELPIRRLEGKWKVSQNRGELDRNAVLAGLDALGTAESRAMMALVSAAASHSSRRKAD